MGRAGDTTGLAVLGPQWRRWTAVVARQAKRRGGSRLSPTDYDALYRELLAACRALAKMGDIDQQPYARRLEALVRPWLAARAFDRADPDILFDLLAQCRRIDRELNGRDWGAVARAWLRPAVACLTGAALMAMVLLALSWVPQPLDDWLRHEWWVVRVAVQESTDIQRFLAVGVVVALGAAFWAHRARRA
jgi:hypothetical protein